MISELAIADIEELKSKGLNPDVKDIIRLNALGLQIEKCIDTESTYTLPRVAFLGNEAFREPTLAHTNWIDQMMSYHTKSDDYSSYIAVNAYALSRNEDTLPDIFNKKLCVDSIQNYCDNNLRKFTIRQISAAIKYALYGAEQTSNEFPLINNHDKDKNMYDYINDPLTAVGCGILIKTLALGLGISVREIQKLTLSQINRLEYMALRSKGFTDKQFQETAQGMYFTTLDAITERLTKEKEKNG